MENPNLQKNIFKNNNKTNALSDNILNPSVKWHQNSCVLWFWNIVTALWNVKSSRTSHLAILKPVVFAGRWTHLKSSSILNDPLNNSVQTRLSKFHDTLIFFLLKLVHYIHSKTSLPIRNKSISLFPTHSNQNISFLLNVGNLKRCF